MVRTPPPNLEQLQAQMKGLEVANLKLQARALTAELEAMRATIALINVKGPIAEAQLEMLHRQLQAMEPKPTETPTPGAVQ